jgi:hypothetical protein
MVGQGIGPFFNSNGTIAELSTYFHFEGSRSAGKIVA